MTLDLQNTVKPPLGIKPRAIHNEERMKEIVAAMQRYIDVGRRPPKEWIEEMLTHYQ